MEASQLCCTTHVLYLCYVRINGPLVVFSMVKQGLFEAGHTLANTGTGTCQAGSTVHFLPLEEETLKITG